MEFSKDVLKRFGSKVDFKYLDSGEPDYDQCWEWNGYCDKNGYGIFAINSKSYGEILIPPAALDAPHLSKVTLALKFMPDGLNNKLDKILEKFCPEALSIIQPNKSLCGEQ